MKELWTGGRSRAPPKDAGPTVTRRVSASAEGRASARRTIAASSSPLLSLRLVLGVAGAEPAGTSGGNRGRSAPARARRCPARYRPHGPSVPAARDDGPEGVPGLGARGRRVLAGSTRPGSALPRGARTRRSATPRRASTWCSRPRPSRTRGRAATRGEATLSTLGVATSVLDREQIAERQAPALLRSRAGRAGRGRRRAPGGIGSQGSVFVRGGESRFARVLVDGVPVNQPGGSFDFGSALPFELERVEVVRGAASSLYGTDALAGVIQTRDAAGATGRAPGLPRRGRGRQLRFAPLPGGQLGPLRELRLERGPAAPRHRQRGAEQRLRGDGRRRLGRARARASERAPALVIRGEDATLGTPGQTAFGRPDLEARSIAGDVVAGVSLRHGRGNAAHELRLGFATTRPALATRWTRAPTCRNSKARSARFQPPTSSTRRATRTTRERLSAGYQAEIQAGPATLVTAGLDIEHETGEIGSRAEPLLSPSRTNAGGLLAGPLRARRACLS